MLSGPISCFDDVVWFEPGVDPAKPLDGDNHNTTRPLVDETRHVRIRHRQQEPVGERMWLLFQSAQSLFNGFAEPESDLDSAAIVEVEVLSQTPLPNRKANWDDVEYRAQVRCLQVVALVEITSVLSTCRPHHWPNLNSQVQLFETPSFIFVWLVTQESIEWFVLTQSSPPRIILECYSVEREAAPISVCNYEWDWTKWPHRVLGS